MSEEKNKKSEHALREEKILEFWRENDIFSKTLKEREGRKEFIFYEGPPTANGKPGIHHLEARAFKDAIPRYKTMQGYHVRRKGGWDTHGLPVELQVEKELDLNSKKEIEKYGIAEFNKKCKESVWQYTDLWEKFTDRIGYWVDQKNPYVTYDNHYIESLWHVLGEVEKQKLLYKDYKVVPWCPRCGTALSSHELAQGYETVKDISIYAKFKVKGEKNTFFLAWTTTPWTLPGNVALAVGADIDYVKIKKDHETFILAESRLKVAGEGYEILEKVKGKALVGLEYEPLFPYIKDAKPEGIGNAYKVYSADFVTTEDGTGIVHTAVMYGAEDFNLGTKVGLPKYHLVDENGNFIKGTDFLERRFVKEKDEEAKPTMDIDIIKYLQGENLFFAKELYEHSYPHCWRCKTPLIYYARDSWYIRMSAPKIKNKLIKENQKIAWEPEHIREGRFGEWLREVKDWAISRERYWGTPLPIWEAEDGESMVVDSIATLKKYIKPRNNYFVARHGESESNAQNIVSGKEEDKHHLTERGKREAAGLAQKLKNKKIDLIISSPFARAKETTEIVAEVLEMDKRKLIFDDRVREIYTGDFEGRQISEYRSYFNETIEKFTKAPPGEGAETLRDVRRRVSEFLFDIDEKYEGKNILIVTHEYPIWQMEATAHGLTDAQSAEDKSIHSDFLKTAELRVLDFVALPHDEDGQLDLHRPYIDEIELEKKGKKFRRVKEVMDVWFDSGAMPFAEDHYPFENKKWIKRSGYPADFISEAIDQTRGWFYTLHAVGVLMGRGRAYKNVICLGHLLDKEGQKMSKSKGNVIDPWEMIEKYGVDTLRLWMYSVNAPGESKNFDERTVLDLNRQVFGLLYNVLAFYELYREENLEKEAEQETKTKVPVLDEWILSRLNELVELSTRSMDNYQLLEPVRATREFISDLSTWYLRRSRDRLKEGSLISKITLYHTLKTLAKLLAPFAPFAAEDIWQKLKTSEDVESVHLASWPVIGKINRELISDMQKVRELVSLGLKDRQMNNTPVRQPLAMAVIPKKLREEYIEIIKDELNIKEIRYDEHVETISLDFNITDELKKEGEYRELLRKVQDKRKEMGLKPSDAVSLVLPEAQKTLVDEYMDDLKKTAGLNSVSFEPEGDMRLEK